MKIVSSPIKLTVLVGGLVFTCILLLLLGVTVKPFSALKAILTKKNSVDHSIIPKQFWLDYFLMSDSSSQEPDAPKVNCDEIFSTVSSDMKTAKDSKQISTGTKSGVGSFKLSRKKSRGAGLKRRLPTAIIIGVKKCGTGALKHFLNLNDRIVVTHKEPYFFNYCYYKGAEWYRKQMRYSYPDQITVDKTPDYFSNETSALRIRNMNPKIKLMIVVCDPVKRVVSHWLQLHVRYNKGTSDTLRTALFYENGTLRESRQLIQLSLYAKHLKNYLKYFPYEQIHVVDGGNLIKNPSVEMKKVEHFLGIQPKKIKFFWNQEKGFYCWKNKGRRHCFGSSKGRKHPTLELWMKEALVSYFEPNNQEFYQLLDKNFNWH